MGDVNGYHGFREIDGKKKLGWYIQPSLFPTEIEEIIYVMEAREYPNKELVQYLKEVLAIVEKRM